MYIILVAAGTWAIVATNQLIPAGIRWYPKNFSRDINNKFVKFAWVSWILFLNEDCGFG